MFGTASPALWIGFVVIVVILLAIDLGLFNRHAHRVKMREALIWSGVWIGVAMIFCAVVWVVLGSEAGTTFLTGYLIEKSLSVDNLFVFLVIFNYYGVKPEFQHRVLFWGIIGAVVMRAIMIAGGAALIERFDWILYLFGVFLIYTAWKLAFMSDHVSVDPGKNKIVRWVGRHVPMTDAFHGEKFWVVEQGKRLATPMLLVLVTIETSDVMFAVDSIPAIFGITHDVFIVYTSNIFAILGLRALYFVLADFMGRFRYLDTGLALVLGFIGVKMLVHDVWHMPTWLALGVVAVILTGSVVLSWLRPEPDPTEAAGVSPEVKPTLHGDGPEARTEG
jgi:tellurite resistance protein TerC